MARRMALQNLESLAEYQHYLQEHPAEVEALHQEILINVTSFFRDAEAFEALKQEVFPALLRGRDRHDPIRIWVAGCSTGEEAYSIAICWLEYLTYQTYRQPIQIFAVSSQFHRARAVHFCAPKPHQRSAVFSTRSGELPQRVDLFWAGIAGKGFADVSLRLKTPRLFDAGVIGNGGRFQRFVCPG